MLELIFTLLFVYQIKHFIVDYLLQNTYMLGKFNRVGWFWPLIAHTSMHGIATLIIALWFDVGHPNAIMLALIDMLIHTVVDKTKVDISRDVGTDKKQFWWFLGFDQMAHHLTHYLLIWIIVNLTTGVS